MPDLAMCFNKECPRCHDCYRFMAIPNEWQYYSEFDAENCKDFMEIDGRKTRIIAENEYK